MAIGVVLALSILAAGCGTGPTEVVLDVIDPATLAPDEYVSVEPEMGAETGVIEYFANVDWLETGALEPKGAILDHLAGFWHPQDDGVMTAGRHNGRGPWWRPGFMSGQDPLFDLANTATDTHPVINYDYRCADGRMAYVSHYVHETEEFRRSWQRPDFIGEIADEGTPTTAHRPIGLDSFRYGFLEVTGVAGPYAGGFYVLSPRLDLDESGVSDSELLIYYGFYQYFGFTTADGEQVEVQISAPSLDFPDEHPTAEIDNARSILTGPTDPLDLVDHEAVQARFQCGQELANRLAPIVAGLDHA